MPVRTLLELLHMVVGVLATLVLAWLAAWSVPNARGSIVLVAWIVAGLGVVMSVPALLRAWAQDRRRATVETPSD